MTLGESPVSPKLRCSEVLSAAINPSDTIVQCSFLSPKLYHVRFLVDEGAGEGGGGTQSNTGCGT